MFLPFGVQPRPESDGVEQLDGRVREDAGADPRQDVLLASGLDQYRIDALIGQQVGQKEAGRAGSDDGDFGTHGEKYTS